MPCLEARILAAFKQAMEEGQLDVAEHLLCALETCAPWKRSALTICRAPLVLPRT